MRERQGGARRERRRRATRLWQHWRCVRAQRPIKGGQHCVVTTSVRGGESEVAACVGVAQAGATLTERPPSEANCRCGLKVLRKNARAVAVVPQGSAANANAPRGGALAGEPCRRTSWSGLVSARSGINKADISLWYDRIPHITLQRRPLPVAAGAGCPYAHPVPGPERSWHCNGASRVCQCMRADSTADARAAGAARPVTQPGSVWSSGVLAAA